MMEPYIKIQVDNEHERRFRVNFQNGTYCLVYVRHPNSRNVVRPNGERETHQIYVTRLQDSSLGYDDFKRLQDAINFIAVTVKETKPQYEAIMADTTRRVDVYS